LHRSVDNGAFLPQSSVMVLRMSGIAMSGPNLSSNDARL